MSQSGRAAWTTITAVAVGLSLWSLVDGVMAGFDTGPGCCLRSDGFNVTGCENVENDLNCRPPAFPDDEFEGGQICGADNTSCREPVDGCCQSSNSTMCLPEDELGCALNDGIFLENQTCSPLDGASAALSGPAINMGCATYTPTATASATATPTATDTPTATNTPTGTDTPTATNTPIATDTATPTNTPSATDTPTATATATMIPDGGDCVDPTDCQSGNCVDDVCCESACDGPNEACNLSGLEGNCLALAATVPAASNNGMILAVVGLLAVALVALLRRRAMI